MQVYQQNKGGNIDTSQLATVHVGSNSDVESYILAEKYPISDYPIGTVHIDTDNESLGIYFRFAEFDWRKVATNTQNYNNFAFKSDLLPMGNIINQNTFINKYFGDITDTTYFKILDVLGFENYLKENRLNNCLRLSPYVCDQNKLYLFKGSQKIEMPFSRSTTKLTKNQFLELSEISSNVPDIQLDDDNKPFINLEPQSTNLWVGSDGTDATYTTPLGEFGFTNINGYTFESIQNVVGKTVSMFFLVKKSDNSAPIIGSSGNASADVVVRLAGSSGVSSQFTTTDLGNGFYLAEVENYAVTGTNTTQVNIQNNSGVDTFISMVQLEELSYSTSYIPTLNGTIETRTQDTSSKSGLSNYINSSEGTFYFYGKALADSSNNRYISLSDDSNNNYIQIRVSNSNVLQVRTFKDGSGLEYISSSLTDTTNYYKCAVVWDNSKLAFFVNGVKIQEKSVDNSYPINTLDTLTFNNALVGSSSNYEGKVKDLRVYTTAYTDSEAIDLTTL